MVSETHPPSLAEINRSYETTEAVTALSTWYATPKEKAFISYVFDRAPLPPSGPVVEIGGGAGLHGLLLQQRFGPRFIHSDYSGALVAKARSFGLDSREIDGLAMPFEDRSVAGLFLVGPSTIVGSEELRRRQFAECYRVLAPGACAIFVTGRFARARGRHCLTRRDLAILRDTGFEVIESRYWGLIPGRFWTDANGALLAGIERIVAGLSLGLRRIVTVRRR